MLLPIPPRPSKTRREEDLFASLLEAFAYPGGLAPDHFIAKSPMTGILNHFPPNAWMRQMTQRMTNASQMSMKIIPMIPIPPAAAFGEAIAVAAAPAITNE